MTAAIKKKIGDEKRKAPKKNVAENKNSRRKNKASAAVTAERSDQPPFKGCWWSLRSRNFIAAVIFFSVGVSFILPRPFISGGNNRPALFLFLRPSFAGQYFYFNSGPLFFCCYFLLWAAINIGPPRRWKIGAQLFCRNKKIDAVKKNKNNRQNN